MNELQYRNFKLNYLGGEKPVVSTTFLFPVHLEYLVIYAVVVIATLPVGVGSGTLSVLVATHEQSDAARLATWSASRKPQPLRTQFRAEPWMAEALLQRQR